MTDLFHSSLCSNNRKISGPYSVYNDMLKLIRESFFLYPTLHKKCPYSEQFWSVFTRIWTEYGEILRISSYSIQMPENTNQNNSKYGHFLQSATFFPSTIQPKKAGLLIIIGFYILLIENAHSRVLILCVILIISVH